MKKCKTKKVALALLTAFGFACAGGGVMALQGASAATSTSDFEIMGASMRLADPDGIRFVAQAKADLITGNAQYGIIVLPADMDTGANLVLGTNGSLTIPCDKLWSEAVCDKYGVEDGYVAFSGALVASQENPDVASTFPESFYNRPLTAVGYVTTEGGETIYTEKVTRSISYVATMERLSAKYEENEVVERIADAATVELTLNSGATLSNLLKAYTPTLEIGGIPVDASAANVVYTSSNQEAATIVDGKVQPVADGETTITATVSLGGEKTVSVSTDVTIDVFKEAEWVVLNDATGDFMAYGDGSTTSMQSSAADPVGAGCVKVTANRNEGWFYLPLTEDGVVLKTRSMRERFVQFVLDIYVPNTLAGNIITPSGILLPAGTTAGWHQAVLSVDQMSTDFNDVAGLIVMFLQGGETAYFGRVVALTAGPNYKPEQLATPVVEIWEDGTATWAPVEGATAYAYATDGLNFTVTNETSVKLTTKSIVRVKALGDGDYYKDSAMSKEVSYLKKDVLNACESAEADWAQGVSGTVELSTQHVVQGNYSIKATASGGAETGGFMALFLFFKKEGAPVTLAQLKAYDYIEFDVHAEHNARIYYYNHHLALMLAGETRTLRVPKSVIEAQAGGYTEATGQMWFQVQSCEADFAPANVYVDNIIGVYAREKADADTTAILNDASVGFAVEHAFNTTNTISTADDPVGAGYAKAVSTAAWAAAYLPFKKDGAFLTTAALQQAYTHFTFKIYIDGAYGIDIPTRSIASGDGWHDVTITAEELSQINGNGFQNYNDIAGLFISVPSAGATFYIGEVTGHKKVATSSVNFGNAYILGDSYSTYKGWIPLDDYAFYADDHIAVHDVTQTWWHQVLSATGSSLMYNDAIGGTTIGYTGYEGQDYKSISFITRFLQAVESGYFERNRVDTVFIFGGTNDAWAGAPLGEAKYAGWTEADLYSIYPALCYLIQAINTHLPYAKIVVLGNDWGFNLSATTAGMSTAFSNIVSHYKSAGLDIDYIPVYMTDAHMVSNHPNQEGMDVISNTILNYYG